MLHINLDAALYHNSNNDDFHAKVAETLDEACKLLETGLEYVTEMAGKKLLLNENRKLLDRFQN